MKKIFFNDIDIKNIINLYINGISSEKICLMYGVSPSLICRLLTKNNIKLKGNKKEVNELEIISIYLSNNFTMDEICRKFGVSKHKIRKVLLSNSVESKSSKKYNYYDDIFEKIDTEEKAYWLGFLFADGYVRKRKSNSELRLKLSSIDKKHLLKFKTFISPDDIPVVYEESKNKSKNGREYKKSKTFKISINSRKIVDDLIKLGCVNKKSLIIEFPKIDSKLEHHFIRGYFDGDGSISYSKKIICVNFVSGSSLFLEKLSSILNIRSGCKLANLVGSSKIFKYLNYTTSDDINKIFKYLYDGSIFLERKYEKFKYIFDNYDSIKFEIGKYRKMEYNKNKVKINDKRREDYRNRQSLQ